MIEGHGDDLYKFSLPITENFSSNLTNWIDASPLKQYLQEKAGEAVSMYPEPQPYSLEALISRRLGIEAEEVCVTNGATEGIYLIAQSFAGKQSAVWQPTFNEYADACRINGHRVTSIFHLPGNGTLPEHINMLWLCNPNNPTGIVTDKSTLISLAENNPDVIFVMDQSYEDFTLQPLLSAKEAVKLPNVLLLHSLTKRYAMPGLRLGYLTGNASLLYHLRTHRMPWSVNGVALLAGTYLFTHPESMPFPLEECLQETQRLQHLLRATGGLEVWETDTHFMLARLRMGTASALKDYLANEQGILIRDASNFEGLDTSCIRISTQKKEDNEKLVRAIEKWFEM